MGDFDACRFDFRLDAKHGLMPSKRKKTERIQPANYSTLFKCKICGDLFTCRTTLLEHKLTHTQQPSCQRGRRRRRKYDCNVCIATFSRKDLLRDHLIRDHQQPQESQSKMTRSPTVVDAPEKSSAELVGYEQGSYSEKIDTVLRRSIWKRLNEERHQIRDNKQSLTVLSNSSSVSFPPITANPHRNNVIEDLIISNETHKTSSSLSNNNYLYINFPIMITPSGDLHRNAVHGLKNPTTFASPDLMSTTMSNLQTLPTTTHIKIEPKEFQDPSSLDYTTKYLRNNLQESYESTSNSDFSMSLNASNSYDCSSSEINNGTSLCSFLLRVSSQQNAQRFLREKAEQVLDYSIKTKPDDDDLLPNSCDKLKGNYELEVVEEEGCRNFDEIVDLSCKRRKTNDSFSLAPYTNINIVSDEKMHLRFCTEESSNRTIRDTAYAKIREKCKAKQSNKSNLQPNNTRSIPKNPFNDNNNFASSSVNSSSSSSSINESTKFSRKSKNGLSSMVEKLWKNKMSKMVDDINDEIVHLSGSENMVDIVTKELKCEEDLRDNLCRQNNEEEEEVNDRSKCLDCQANRDYDDAESRSSQNITNSENKKRRQSLQMENNDEHDIRIKSLFDDDEVIDLTVSSGTTETNAIIKMNKMTQGSSNSWQEELLNDQFTFSPSSNFSNYYVSRNESMRYEGISRDACFVKHIDEDLNLQTINQSPPTIPTCPEQYDSSDNLWRHILSHNGLENLNTHDSNPPHALAVDSGNDKDIEYSTSCLENLEDESFHKFSSSDASSPNDVSIDGRLFCDYPECSKTFKQWRHLKVHQTLHTGEKPLSCYLCKYTCRHRSSMNWHMKNKHRLEKSKTHGNRTVYVNPDRKRLDESKVKESATDESEERKEIFRELHDNLNFLNDCEKSENSNSTNAAMMMSENEIQFQISNEVAEKEKSNNFKQMLSTDVVKYCPSSKSTMKDGSSTVAQLQLKKIIPAPGKDPQFFTSLMRMKYMKHATRFRRMRQNMKKESKEGEGDWSGSGSKADWSKTMQIHKKFRNGFYCNNCGFNADSESELQSHILSTHDKEISDFQNYVCSICGKGYMTKTGLNHHLIKHSDEGDISSFLCPYVNCHSKLQNKAALRLHIRRHQLNVQPEFSPSNDESCNGLSVVAPPQMDERPVSCDYPGCDKSFRELKHLKVHQMQHTDEKPLRCHRCDYSCRQRNSMNWHMKSKHGLDKHVTNDGRTIYM